VPTTDSTGLYIAQYDGLFAKYGLHVNIEPAISAESSVNQLAFNQIQILTGNYVSFLEAQMNYDRGIKPADVPFPPGPNDNQIAANLDIFAEASVMQPGFVGLFTKPGSKIKTIAQLKGKTIGINAPGNVAYLLLASWEAANGLTPPAPDDFAHLKIIPFPNMQQNLTEGKIDVAFLAEPFVSIAEETAGVTEMTNLDEGATTGFPIQGYAATKQWAKTHPNTLAAFEAALEQGQEIASTNRSLAEKATVQYGLLPSMPKNTPVKFADQIATLLQFESYPLGRVDVTRLQRVLNVVKQFNVFPVPGNFSVSELLGD
jgi:NitT/TauT family transport system substrate-binding protein